MAELQERDVQILKHVYRYRVSTNEVLYRLFFPDAKNTESVRRVVTRRLVDRGYLDRGELRGNRRYYHLTTTATKHFGWSDEMAKIGTQTLPEVYATLLYCCTGETIYRRFTREEFRESFSEFAEKIPSFNSGPFDSFYLEPAEDKNEDGNIVRLMKIEVDLGGDLSAYR